MVKQQKLNIWRYREEHTHNLSSLQESEHDMEPDSRA